MSFICMVSLMLTLSKCLLLRGNQQTASGHWHWTADCLGLNFTLPLPSSATYFIRGDNSDTYHQKSKRFHSQEICKAQAKVPGIQHSVIVGYFYCNGSYYNSIPISYQELLCLSWIKILLNIWHTWSGVSLVYYFHENIWCSWGQGR